MKINRPATRQITIFTLKLGITAVFIYLLANRVDGNLLLRTITGIDLRYFFVALLLLAIQVAIHVGLWSLVLQTAGINLSFRRGARILMFSLFLNQGLPAALGGVGGRVYMTWKAGASFGQSVTAALTERLIFLVLLIFTCLLALPYLYSLSGADEIKVYAVFLISAAAAVPALPVVLKQTGRFLKHTAFYSKMQNAMSAWRRLLTMPTVAGRVGILIFIYHGLSISAMWALSAAIDAPISPLQVLALTPHALLLAALPVTINGWGVREVAMSAFLGIAGVSPEAAIAVSVLFGGAVLCTRLPLGLIWFLPDARNILSVQSSDDI